MNHAEQEWKERYIYAVTRRLPKKQRREVALELEELISDMLEDGGTIEEVLVRLGDPAAFAKKYQDGARCLIGPAYFDNYIWLLRIVLICTAAGSFAAGMIEAVRSGVEQESVVQAVMVTVAHGLPGGLLNVAAACLSAFGAVTLIAEQKRIYCSRAKQILYLFTFPVFIFTYIPMAVVALRKNVTWKQIPHTILCTADQICSQAGRRK